MINNLFTMNKFQYSRSKMQFKPRRSQSLLVMANYRSNIRNKKKYKNVRHNCQNMKEWDIFRCQYGCCRLPMRFIVALVVVLAVIVCIGHRAVLPIVISEMVIPNNRTIHRACLQYAKAAKMKKLTDSKKKWDANVQSWVLSMFFPGYVLSQAPGGFICDRWGVRYALLIGVTISGLGTFLTPDLVLNMDWKVVAGSRFVVGFGQGVIYPSMSSFMQRWIPESHRATIGGMVYASGALGRVVGNMATATIVAYFKSWKAAFSFWGTMAVLWVSFAFLYLFSYPDTHAFMTLNEEQFLQDEIGKKSRRPLPIWKVLSSCSVWAYVAGMVSYDIFIFSMSTSFSKYMNDVLNYDIKGNAFVSSIPWVMMWISSSLFGLLSDFLVCTMNANVTVVRKSIALFATIFPFVFLVGATYSKCNRTLAITFFTLAMITKGPAITAIHVTALDLTTSHAGFITGLGNGLGSITGFISTKAIGWVVTENTLEQWHLILWGINATSLFFVIFFVIFGSNERTEWDYLPREYKALPPKTKTKWYLQLSPEEFEEKQMMQMAAAARRAAASITYTSV